VRLEPIILELEREQNDLLIIAHESVLRVLYGYLLACSANEIPTLEFPRDEIIEIIPASYNNSAKRIHIDNVPEHIIPDAPKRAFSGLGVESSKTLEEAKQREEANAT
jgi:6-phosphofructo-2-kinase/fructose-2,6-biphosphatase 4